MRKRRKVVHIAAIRIFDSVDMDATLLSRLPRYLNESTISIVCTVPLSVTLRSNFSVSNRGLGFLLTDDVGIGRR